MPRPVDEQPGFAHIKVKVRWQGQVHECHLEVSDSAGGAVILALLDQAAQAVRDTLGQRIQADFETKLRDKTAQLPAWFQSPEPGSRTRLKVVADKLGQAEPTEVGDHPAPYEKSGGVPDAAPRLPVQESDLPAQGGQCTAIVVHSWTDDKGAHARRRKCGYQLSRTPDDPGVLVCPNEANHVGADKPASMPPEGQDWSPFD